MAFGKNINFPIYIDQIDLGLEDEPLHKWDHLIDRGIIRESFQEDDDNVILMKEFKAFDGSLIKKETIKMSKVRFEEFKIKNMSKQEIADELIKLNSEIEENNKIQNYEMSANLRDKIKLLERIVAI